MKSKLEIRLNRRYTVCPPGELRKLCIINDWFNEGTIRQYDKLFERNCRKDGEDLTDASEIIAIIWLCSDKPREEIAEIVMKKRQEYLERLYEIERRKENEEDLD